MLLDVAKMKRVYLNELKVILATDCGSTTTKAILIEIVDGKYRQTFRGEAPTTVEAPFEDVTRGVLNAIQEIEELVDTVLAHRTKRQCDLLMPSIRIHSKLPRSHACVAASA